MVSALVRKHCDWNIEARGGVRPRNASDSGFCDAANVRDRIVSVPHSIIAPRHDPVAHRQPSRRVPDRRRAIVLAVLDSTLLLGVLLVRLNAHDVAAAPTAVTRVPAAVESPKAPSTSSDSPRSAPRKTSGQTAMLHSSGERDQRSGPGTPSGSTSGRHDPADVPAATAPRTSEIDEKRLGQIRSRLAEVVLRRQATERLLSHLRSERDASKPPAVSEKEIAAAFYAEPEAAFLRSRWESAQARFREARRVTRNDGDVLLAALRKELRSTRDALARQWQRRRPSIAAALANKPRETVDGWIAKAEYELSAFQSEENRLRNRSAVALGHSTRGQSVVLERTSAAVAAP
jgi:hypothetical protein